MYFWQSRCVSRGWLGVGITRRAYNLYLIVRPGLCSQVSSLSVTTESTRLADPQFIESSFRGVPTDSFSYSPPTYFVQSCDVRYEVCLAGRAKLYCSKACCRGCSTGIGRCCVFRKLARLEFGTPIHSFSRVKAKLPCDARNFRGHFVDGPKNCCGYLFWQASA